MCCIQGTYIANIKHKAHSIHLGENMKRTNNSDNRSLLGQIIKIEKTPPQICTPNTVNPPHVYQRVPPQVNEFGNEIVGQSQLAPNPSVNQLESTNIGLISPTINTIDQPRLTLQMFPAAIAAISSNNLETAMKIVGVKSIEELAYSIDVNGTTLLAYAAEYGRAKPIRILLNKVLDPQQLMQKRNNKNCTPLILAAIFGHAKAITTILQGVSNPQQLAEQWDATGVTALINAAINGHVGVITSIFSGVSNPQQLAEQQDNGGSTALMYAAYNGYVEVTASIFSGVSNPQQLAEKQDKSGQTALFSAIHSYVSTLIITKIFESVDDAEKLIFQIDNKGLNSFTYSLRQGNMEAALLLFDKAKDKASLLLKKNSPNQPAAIQTMKPEIQDVFLKKYNEPNH
jgi:ankyrin repeat protein